MQAEHLCCLPYFLLATRNQCVATATERAIGQYDQIDSNSCIGSLDDGAAHAEGFIIGMRRKHQPGTARARQVVALERQQLAFLQ